LQLSERAFKTGSKLHLNKDITDEKLADILRKKKEELVFDYK
jgi:hypothetical protein